MPQQKATLADGTEVVLVKSRQSRNLKLTITAAGQIRVAMPSWIPYGVGLAFAQNNSGWIAKHSVDFQLKPLRDNTRIGKSFRLRYIYDKDAPAPASGKLIGNSITITTPLNPQDSKVQAVAARFCEKALRIDAERYLGPRMQHLAKQHRLNYSSLRFRKLTSRWGSCSHNKAISLNIFLVQLPDQLIDYVILHELAHTKHLNHSAQFWNYLESLDPKTKTARSRLKAYKPRLNPA